MLHVALYAGTREAAIPFTEPLSELTLLRGSRLQRCSVRGLAHPAVCGLLGASPGMLDVCGDASFDASSVRPYDTLCKIWQFEILVCKCFMIDQKLSGNLTE